MRFRMDQGDTPEWLSSPEGRARLEQLERLIQEHRATGFESPPARRAEADAIADELFARARVSPHPLPEELARDSPEHRLWFSQAVLLWLRYARDAGPPRLTTLRYPLRELDLYAGDLPTPAERESIRTALRLAFGWSHAELERLEAGVEHYTTNLSLKHRITEIVSESLTRTEVQEPTSTRDPDARALRLMQQLYSSVPLRAEDVELVVTRTSFYFCIPFEDSRLSCIDFDARPVAERRAIEDFLQRVVTADSPLTDRFPAFGYFERESVSEGFVDGLGREASQRLGREIPHAVIRETLATMVQILPTQLLELYLIHDSCGHVWQETLCEFEWPYAMVPHLNRPLDLATGPFFGSRPGEGCGPGFGERFDAGPRDSGSVAELASCFLVRGDRTELSESRAEACLRADLEGRIAIGAHGVLAEILADIADHKLARQQRPLASKSLFATRVVRLDLILADIRLFAELWTAPYRDFARNPREREPLYRALIASGHPEAGMQASLERLARLIQTHLRSGLARESEASGASEPDICDRLFAEAISLAAELEHFIAERIPDAPHSRANPCRSLDLLGIVLGWFHDQSRGGHPGELGALLHHALRNSFQRLEANLPS